MREQVRTIEAGRRYLLGEWILEPEKRHLSRDGQTAHLANKPFQVLLYLIEHRDRVVSRMELLDRFWDGSEVYDATLTQCVGAIRKALDDRNEKPRFIETRWAEGYRYIGSLEEDILPEEIAFLEIEKTRGIKLIIEEDEISYDDSSGEFVAPQNESIVLSVADAPAEKRLVSSATVSKQSNRARNLLVFSLWRFWF